MNSREQVLTVFEHRKPDRVPYWCGASAEFWEKAKKQLPLNDECFRKRFGDDFRRVFSEYAGPPMSVADGCTYRTIFNIERMGLGYGQPTTYSLANAVSDVIDIFFFGNDFGSQIGPLVSPNLFRRFFMPHLK